MNQENDDWSVLPHAPIEKLSENLWRIEGDLPLPASSMRRVMTIARRSDGDLVIHSAIALEEEAMCAIEAFGRPAYLLVPHARHWLDVPGYKKRYRTLRVLATRGARAKAEDAAPFDGDYADFPPDRDVSLQVLRGVKEAEGAMIVRSSDGVTVVLNEVVLDLDALDDDDSFLSRMLFRALRLAPVPEREHVRERRALREDLARLAETRDLTRLIVSHEGMSRGADARATLRNAAGYL
jgi:hypothetical protein